jgi:hypothetical protein
MGVEVLPTDTNRSLHAKLINLWSNIENTTRQGVLNSLCNLLGYDHYNIITRRIFILSEEPRKGSEFIVTVDNVVQVQIDEDDYSTATSGYIVWKGFDGGYTRILEFINPPTYTRRTTSRKHYGQFIEVAYQYEEREKDATYTIFDIVDRCAPYDPSDVSFMGYYPESEGDVGVYVLNDPIWLENNMKDDRGRPNDALWGIFQEVDRMSPTTWGA